MRAPGFWWQTTASPAARLLSPFASLYGIAAVARLRRNGARLPLPILCIGNFVAGGAGKTPAALALAERLIAQGERPFFLSRGYRSAAERGAPVRVDPLQHRAADVGDEPLLLARVAPTIVGADRLAAGRLAEAAGASLLILDDGLQNPALEKDLRLAMVDGATGIGNGLCLPAGPLRAPLAAQIDITDGVILVGEGAPGETVAAAVRAAGRPVIRAQLAIPAPTAGRLAGRKVFAFAGIGLPQKFYRSLAAAGADIAATRSFPDHHAYSADEIDDLRRRALQLGATLVTTEKDFVRLADLGLSKDDPAQPLLAAVPVELVVDDAVRLDGMVAAALARVRAGRR